VVSLTYEHIVSRGAHGEFFNGVYQRLREADREVWFGSDGSGLMTEAWTRSSFFIEEQRREWQTAQHRATREDPTPSMDLFAAGCLPGHGPTLAKLPVDPSALASKLEARRMLTLHSIGDLIGEALVPDLLLRAFHHVAARLPGAEVLATATDELGRNGPGITRVERGKRAELIFDPNSWELVGSREVMVDLDAGYAPPGTVVGWTSYLSREIVDSLPAGTPPVPGPPCSPPGSGRGTRIQPGFSLSTGYFTDLGPHLKSWQANGVITAAQYDALKHQP
jgi:hypothetical protein